MGPVMSGERAYDNSYMIMFSNIMYNIIVLRLIVYLLD